MAATDDYLHYGLIISINSFFHKLSENSEKCQEPKVMYLFLII